MLYLEKWIITSLQEEAKEEDLCLHQRFALPRMTESTSGPRNTRYHKGPQSHDLTRAEQPRPRHRHNEGDTIRNKVVVAFEPTGDALKLGWKSCLSLVYKASITLYIMRFIHLLALCSSALASPCKPSASSATAVVTTTEEPVLSTTQPVTVSESAVTSEFTSEPTTTTSAEPSTTTSDVPQQPSNLLRNADFEDGTIAPWVASRDFGNPALSNAEAHGGSQSGYISASPGGPADIGFRQVLDASLIEADKPYTFSVYVKTTVASSCFNRFVSCDAGTGSQAGYLNTGSIAGPLNEWVLASVTCSWNQAHLDNGVSVAVRGLCEHLSFYVDDASLVAVE
ncbi:hypothetical protein FSPOR_566 [Fusarium sporotrichioides]|uniref:CBM-cenC domain-containing protein n=1 Tax=Fusarium sporotrichioides TaxID=5514 RepID=A0A395STH2_FUSSP|nr:hypothetical protein FSPOR_566 [Fusarium sporotrichioides]